MMEVLTFIFQDFWHWLGTFLLIGVCTSPFYGLVRVNIRQKEKMEKKP